MPQRSEIVPADMVKSISDFIDGKSQGTLSPDQMLTAAQAAYDPQFPAAEQKCTSCRGDGVLPIYDYFGKQCGTTMCPVCGGSRYAS